MASKGVYYKYLVLTTFSPWGLFQKITGSYLRSPWSVLAEFRTHPRLYSCPHHLQNEEVQIKNAGARVLKTL